MQDNFEDFEAFVGNANMGVHCVNKDGYVIYANQQELETLGYTKEEYVGHHVSEFQVDEGELEVLMQMLSAGTPIKNYPYRVKGKHGIKHILFNSSVYSKDDEFVHTRCFGSEVDAEIFEVFARLKDSQPDGFSEAS
jgi:PAS domain S-box-containing protein